MSNNFKELLFESNKLRRKIITVKQLNNAEVEIEELGMNDKITKGKKVDEILRGENKDKGKFMDEVVPTIIDKTFDVKTGEKIFQRADRDKLVEGNGMIISEIFAEIIDLSSADIKNIDEAKKN